jgi:hypothetical protein
VDPATREATPSTATTVTRSRMKVRTRQT